MRLNPRYPALYLQEHGKIEFTMRRYPDAIASLEAALERNPNLGDVRLYLAASYAYAGRADDAEWQVLEVLTADPEFSLERAERLYSSRLHSKPAYLDHLIEGLRRAGLPP